MKERALQAGIPYKTVIERLHRGWTEAEALRLTNVRAAQNRKAGNPGPEGSIAKLMFAEVNQRIYELCIDMLGPAGLVDYDYEMKRTAGVGLTGPAGLSRRMFLRSRANSIEGGIRDPAQHHGGKGARSSGRHTRR